jgi:hypothetical protein
MAKKFAHARNVEPITSPTIKRIAGKGLAAPSTLTTREVQKLAASVEAHIEPRKKKKVRDK